MKTKKAFLLLVIYVVLVSIVGINPVHALGTPQIVGISPGSPAPVGMQITVHATVTWDSDFRSMRICFRDTNWCQEDATADIQKTFNTSGLAPGHYEVLVQVAGQGDNNWSNATSTSAGYELTAPAPPPGPSKGPTVQFSFSPSDSQTVGNSVNIHVVVGSNNPGATKINVSCGGVSKIETSETEFDSSWNTNGCDSGPQQVTICARSTDDPNWANPTCQTRNYSLSPAAITVPTPSAKFWADSNNIQSGQCTNIHWQTNGANSVNIDGSSVSTSGDQQVCPTVTRKYTLTATNQSGSSYRNLTIVVSNQPASSNVIEHFQTGEVIQIGYDVYVIVNGERRHVPNPATLDALGIPRSWINNKGFSNSELMTIPQGNDVPDVNRDPSAFAAFKNSYFQNTTPTDPGQGVITAVPNGPASTEQLPGPGSSSCQWYVGARVGLKAGAAIRVGSGMTYGIEKIVPSDNWQVDIIDGPRYSSNVTWWDISRQNLDGGGTGWVFFEQASKCSYSPSQNSPAVTPEIPTTLPATEMPLPGFDTNPPQDAGPSGQPKPGAIPEPTKDQKNIILMCGRAIYASIPSVWEAIIQCVPKEGACALPNPSQEEVDFWAECLADVFPNHNLGQ
jgi:hypothetical protein